MEHTVLIFKIVNINEVPNHTKRHHMGVNQKLIKDVLMGIPKSMYCTMHQELLTSWKSPIYYQGGEH